MGIKKTRLLLALVVALVMATGVSLVIQKFLAPRPLTERETPKETTTQILVAKVPVRVGTRLKPEHLKSETWPLSSLPLGSFARADEIVGRAVLSNLIPNEPIVKEKLASAQSGGGLPAVIPDGRRALTIRVDEVIGVAGFVVPDTRVDILMTRDIAGRLITKTILQNMLVLAAGQQVQTDSERNPIPAPVVTLLVTPEEAEKVTLAGSEGRLQLVLRNPSDFETGKTPGATLASVFEGDHPRVPSLAKPVAPPAGQMVKVSHKPPPPLPSAPPPRTVYEVEVIKDNVSSVEKFYLE